MDFLKNHTKELYFVAAILMFIVGIIENSTVWTILGCANVVLGINYRKEK